MAERRFIPTHVGNTTPGTLRATSRSVHPHTRGEHLHEKGWLDNVYGSSPHTWGTLGSGPTDTAALSVHPHTRGEHCSVISSFRVRIGSSPHTWGTHTVCVVQTVRDRFIPTHVGNTGTRRRGSGRRPVHPHTRGEHGELRSAPTDPRGSSPHTWGTRQPDQWYRVRARFIPTHVGNTMREGREDAVGTVHPHTRGEHPFKLSSIDSERGSSPHTWGTQDPAVRVHALDRFIPTHVGNTVPVVLYIYTVTVHPHTRGEHGTTESLLPGVYGSSPHTWGTPFMYRLLNKPYRFIPTHVGNTISWVNLWFFEPVHPHTRGEHINVSQIYLYRLGSSPHTWGTQVRRQPFYRQPRFIPTHVGNTIDVLCL